MLDLCQQRWLSDSQSTSTFQFHTKETLHRSVLKPCHEVSQASVYLSLLVCHGVKLTASSAAIFVKKFFLVLIKNLVSFRWLSECYFSLFFQPQLMHYLITHITMPEKCNSKLSPYILPRFFQ